MIGVGTGSTANFFIDMLAELKNEFDGAVASSEATAERLKSHGIPVYDLNSTSELEFYVDGADETNERLELIKGGGAALTRERLSQRSPKPSSALPMIPRWSAFLAASRCRWKSSPWPAAMLAGKS